MGERTARTIYSTTVSAVVGADGGESPKKRWEIPLAMLVVSSVVVLFGIGQSIFIYLYVCFQWVYHMVQGGWFYLMVVFDLQLCEYAVQGSEHAAGKSQGQPFGLEHLAGHDLLSLFSLLWLFLS